MENDNPSLETQEAIKDGINWLANWYKDRCDAGVISSDEYARAIEKLQQTKIYTTKQGTNRVTEELEKGDLHLKSELVEIGATVKMWKNHMNKNNVFPFGWCAKKQIEEPVITIDVDKIKEERGNDSQEITSVVIHELTHLTADVFGADHDVESIICGFNKDGNAKRIDNLHHNQSVEYVTIEPNIITDTDTPLVIPKIHKDKNLPNNLKDETPDFMKDGIFYDRYLDGSNEIYARMMQLRYENGLKADELIRNEDINRIQHDVNIVNRYQPEIIKSVLNGIAGIDIKGQMKKDAKSAYDYMSGMEGCFAKQSSNTSENKPNNINKLILHGLKDRSFS